jgi:hypothetical protein
MSFKKQDGDEYEYGRRKRRRRRIDKLDLSEISAVGRPAQEPAVAAIMKSQDFDEWLEKFDDEISVEDLAKNFPPRPGESREQFSRRFDSAMADDIPDRSERSATADLVFKIAAGDDEVSKSHGDMVSLLSESEDGHQHGISIGESSEGFYVVVSYAGSDAESRHDHQIVVDGSGNYVMSENLGHSHAIDQERLRQVFLDSMTKSSDSFHKNDPRRAVREDLAKCGESLPDGRFPIRKKADLDLAVKAFEVVSEEDRLEVSKHIASRSLVLGVSPDSGPIADILNSTDVTKEGPMPETKPDDRIATLEAELKLYKSLATLSDGERSHYNSLEKDADKAAFLEKSADDRAAILKNLEAEDPVVYTTMSGNEIRKSDGDLMLSLAKEADDSKRDVAKERAKSEKARIEKRAKDELGGLPGSDEVHVAVIKALESIEDEELQKGAFEMMKARGTDFTSITKERGVGGVPREVSGTESKVAEAELDRLAKARQADKGEDYFTAYEEVSKAHPELLEKALA